MTDGETAPDAAVLRRTHRRLLGWVAGSTFVVLVGLGLAIHTAVESSLEAAARDQLRDRATEVSALLSGPFPLGQRGHVEGAAAQAVQPAIVFSGPAAGTLALIVEPSGRVVGLEPTLHDLPLPDMAGVAAARTGQEDVRTTMEGRARLRILSRPIDTPDGRYVIQVVQDRGAEERTLELLRVVLLGGGLLGLGGAIAVGHLYASRALRPIRDALRRQREFAANASHEIRTPLAIIRAGLDEAESHLAKGAAREAVRPLTDVSLEADRLAEMVD